MSGERSMEVKQDADEYDTLCEDLDCVIRNLTQHVEDVTRLANRLFGVISSAPPVPRSKVEGAEESRGIMGQITSHIQNIQTLVEETKEAFSRLEK